MDQLFTLDGEDTTPKSTSVGPNPEKYRHERGECLHPHLALSTAYGYGCRCRGCFKYHQAMAYYRKSGPLPCAWPECNEPRRKVQAARYCEVHTTMKEYRAQPAMVPTSCIACGESKPIHRHKKRKLCPQCQDQHAKLIQQATWHHVDDLTLVRFMHNPECELCGKRFYTGRGRSRSGFTIDHNHDCCPGSSSCGECVRGILCSACNLSLGHVESMIGRATLSGLLSYLAAGVSLM